MSTHKILVAFFSMKGDTYNIGIVEEGNTQILAKYIANYLKADLYQIEGDNKYPEDHMEIVKQAKIEMNQKLRPKLIHPLNNIDQYDIIFIGYPIWYKIPPMSVYSFFESFDFSNKNVYLFCTHEGGGDSGSFKLVKNILNTAKVSTDGFAMKGTESRKADAKEKIEEWLKKLKF